MWADVLTKPLQGLKFREMWAVLMNCPIDYSEDPLFIPSEPVPSAIANDHPTKPQIDAIVPSPRECVGVTSSPLKNIARSKSGGNVFPSK